MSVAPMIRAKLHGRRTAVPLLVAVGLVGAGIAGPQAGCATQTVPVSTRALERSGRVAFVCLDRPSSTKSPLRPITDCDASTVLSVNDYTATEVDGGTQKELPHLYALVTQTTRGEVAVIDTTSTNNSVLDQDPSVPGANFLPIGAQPVDIVSSPGGTATFVGVAEIGREGLFALPSSRIRPTISTIGAGGGGGGDVASTGTSTRLPEMSSWPSCRLPAAPGQMLLLPDPQGQLTPNDKLATRRCCDAAYGAKAGSTCEGDTDVHPDGDLEAEGKGRQKLIVAIPSKGGIAVIDAQSLLDTEPGVYAPCHVERWLPLATDVPVLPTPPPTGGVACVDPAFPPPVLPPTSVARPSGLAYAAGRLYASDLDTSLIHVIDLPTPCEPVEQAPLLPTSVQDPKRVVTTTHVAVAPSLTPDLKRYLYAVDALDGSAMVFDVSDDQASRFPLQRPRPEWDPLAPRDRIRFSAPAADLLIVQRDVPEPRPATGVATEGVRCDPTSTNVCLPTSEVCDPGTLYRTDLATYASGAGPLKLRGTFAFLALTSGRIAVVDIDDYDAPCRGPAQTSNLFGCDNGIHVGGVTTNELSCNVVLPNTPRASTYFAANDAAGQHQAGIQSFPQLFDTNGAPIDEATLNAPKMVATLPVLKTLQEQFQLSVSSIATPIDPASGVPFALNNGVYAADPVLINKSTLMMNLEDPRAQIVDQNWFVTFEGPLPGFAQKLAALNLHGNAGAVDTLNDASSRFCDAGVQSKKAVLDKLGATTPTSEAAAARLADYVDLQTELPDQAALYWASKDKNGNAVKATCSFDVCRSVFGSVDVPASGRHFTIDEAFEDNLQIEPRVGSTLRNSATGLPLATWRATTDCCFPSLVTFNVRVGDQWEVAGNQSGFLHHVIADPASGVCRDSCDATQARTNGRAYRVAYPLAETGTKREHQPPVKDNQPGAFINPMFRFAVLDPPAIGGVAQAPVIGEQFRFSTLGAFKPLVISLSTEGATLIQPVGMAFVQSTGQLAVTDGSINGLLMVDLSSSAVARTYF
jgi:hypothetical protein